VQSPSALAQDSEVRAHRDHPFSRLVTRAALDQPTGVGTTDIRTGRRRPRHQLPAGTQHDGVPGTFVELMFPAGLSRPRSGPRPFGPCPPTPDPSTLEQSLRIRAVGNDR